MVHDAKQRAGYRLGWVLYWTFLVLIAAWGLFVWYLFLTDDYINGSLFEDAFLLMMAFGVPLVLFGLGLGRASRYVLAGD